MNCGLWITATTAKQDWPLKMTYPAIIHITAGMNEKQLLYRQLL